MTTDREEWEKRKKEHGQNPFFRSFSKFEVDTLLGVNRLSIEERIFDTIKNQFELGDFKVFVDEFPLPCQQVTQQGKVQYTNPHDREKGIPVAVLRTNTYAYSYADLAPHLYSGFEGVVDSMTEDLVRFLRGHLENLFGEEYLDRKGELWFFGLPCFNWDASLCGLETQVSAMVGGMFTRSGGIAEE